MSRIATPRPVLAWEQFKDWLSASVHLTHHELHVVVGLALFVIVARVMRRPLRSIVPLLVVALFELANEASDFIRYYTSGWPWTPHETLVDIALTLGPPLGLIGLSWIVSMRRERTSASAEPAPAGVDQDRSSA